MSKFKTLALASLVSVIALASVPALAESAPVAKSARPAAATRSRSDDLQLALNRETQRADVAMKEVERLREELKVRGELLSLGIQRNAELTALAQEVIDKGVSTSTWEPFLQRHRVEMENLKQSYEDRVRAARIFDTTLAPSVEKRMQEELARSKAEAEPAAKN